MRVILFTGKGGVGKTCTAAATGLRAANLGLRTLVISTDPAHSLGDALDCTLGDDPVMLAPNFEALELDPYRETEQYWGRIQRQQAALMIAQGVDQAIAAEIAGLPGLGEILSLVRLARYNRESAYDLVVVDCAPTGESLRLLNLPQILNRGLKASGRLDRYFIKPLATSMVKVASTLSSLVPDEGVTKAWGLMLLRLGEICRLLVDPEVTSVRLVMNPEKMVIKESQRALTNLNLYGIGVDAVVVNRVLSQEASEGFMAEWYQRQQHYLDLIDSLFCPIPKLTSPLYQREIVGLEALDKLGDDLYADANPAGFFYQGRALQVEREGDSWVLSLHLPIVHGESFEVRHLGNELDFRVKGRRYQVVLPDLLAGMEPGKAKLTEGRLRVPFTPKTAPTPAK